MFSFMANLFTQCNNLVGFEPSKINHIGCGYVNFVVTKPHTTVAVSGHLKSHIERKFFEKIYFSLFAVKLLC